MGNENVTSKVQGLFADLSQRDFAEDEIDLAGLIKWPLKEDSIPELIPEGTVNKIIQEHPANFGLVLRSLVTLLSKFSGLLLVESEVQTQFRNVLLLIKRLVPFMYTDENFERVSRYFDKNQGLVRPLLLYLKKSFFVPGFTIAGIHYSKISKFYSNLSRSRFKFDKIENLSQYIVWAGGLSVPFSSSDFPTLDTSDVAFKRAGIIQRKKDREENILSNRKLLLETVLSVLSEDQFGRSVGVFSNFVSANTMLNKVIFYSLLNEMLQPIDGFFLGSPFDSLEGRLKTASGALLNLLVAGSDVSENSFLRMLVLDQVTDKRVDFFLENLLSIVRNDTVELMPMQRTAILLFWRFSFHNHFFYQSVCESLVDGPKLLYGMLRILLRSHWSAKNSDTTATILFIMFKYSQSRECLLNCIKAESMFLEVLVESYADIFKLNKYVEAFREIQLKTLVNVSLYFRGMSRDTARHIVNIYKASRGRGKVLEALAAEILNVMIGYISEENPLFVIELSKRRKAIGRDVIAYETLMAEVRREVNDFDNPKTHELKNLRLIGFLPRPARMTIYQFRNLDLCLRITNSISLGNCFWVPDGYEEVIQRLFKQPVFTALSSFESVSIEISNTSNGSGSGGNKDKSGSLSISSDEESSKDGKEESSSDSGSSGNSKKEQSSSSSLEEVAAGGKGESLDSSYEEDAKSIEKVGTSGEGSGKSVGGGQFSRKEEVEEEKGGEAEEEKRDKVEEVKEVEEVGQEKVEEAEEVEAPSAKEEEVEQEKVEEVKEVEEVEEASAKEEEVKEVEEVEQEKVEEVKEVEEVEAPSAKEEEVGPGNETAKKDSSAGSGQVKEKED